MASQNTDLGNDPVLFDNGIYPFVQTGDVARSGGVIRTFTGKYNETGLAQSAMWPAGTLCITIAANIADSGILSFDACFPDSVVGLIPASDFQNARYFDYFVRTVKSGLLEFAPSTAQKNINLRILSAVLIPLPPLREQHRIVAKVDELMALCDRLEAAREARETKRDRLTAASLARLNRPDPDAETFRAHVAQTLEMLDPLTTRPDQIKQLRQTILNLAVHGKLVPQDQNDEPVSELLSRINEAKAARKQETRDARIKLVPDVSTELIPFDLPKCWRAQSFENIFLFIDYRGKTPPKTASGIPLITAKNVRKGTTGSGTAGIRIRVDISGLDDQRFSKVR